MLKKHQLIRCISRYEKSLKECGFALAVCTTTLLPPGNLIAQPLPKGSEFLINTDTSSSKGYPVVTMDDDGDFVVCWQSYGQDGQYWDIYARRYDSSGVALDNEFLVNTHTGNTQQSPSISSDRNGNFVIAWQSFAQEGFTNNIYAQRYDTSGLKKGVEFRVNDPATSDQENPSVSMTDLGYFLVAWESGDHNIYAKNYNKNGVVRNTQFQANVISNGNLHNPAVSAHATGFFTAVWDNNIGDVNSYGIRRQAWDVFPNGVNPVSYESLVNTYSTEAQTKPAIAIDNNGQFEVVVWQSFGQDGDNNGIYGRRYFYYDNHHNVSSEFQINTFTAGEQSHPAVAMDHNGNFVVTWQSTGQDGDGTGIYARRFHVDGTPYGDEFLVNTYTSGNQHNPSIAMDSDGDFVITWESQDGGSHDGIFAQRYALPCESPQNWYYDMDQDGYGKYEHYTFIACEQLPNTVADYTDCNDTIASIHPGAPEYCNDIDDDCDTRIDDNVISCPVPAAFSTTEINATSATLEWATVPCAVKNKIQLVRVFDKYAVKIDGNLSGSNPVDGLLPSTLYRWNVKTKCSDQVWSVASPWQYFTTSAVLQEFLIGSNAGDISDQAVPGIMLSPNPATGIVRIQQAQQPFGEIRIIDMTGKVAWQLQGLNTNEYEADISQLVAGIYCVQVLSENNIRAATLLIQN